MVKVTAIVMTLTALLVWPALAACPPAVDGDFAGAVQANQQRILCLQRELSAAAQQQQGQFRLRQLEQNQQSYVLQRRFDALPAPSFPPATWR